jgi:hypothetical protein
MEVKDVVLIVVTSIFPSEKGIEIQRKYTEIQEKFPLPPFIKQKQMDLRWIKEGMKGVAVYKVEKGKIAEALNFIYRYEVEYGGIEGYSNDIETLLEIEDLTGVISL